MNLEHQQKRIFNNKIIMIGFGSIGQAVLPLLFNHFDLKPEQVAIFCKDSTGEEVAHAYQVSLQKFEFKPDNYLPMLDKILEKGDFLLNLSVNVASIELMKLCQEKEILYLDTSTEPWAGGYTDKQQSMAHRTNYFLREKVLALKQTGPTALITHGANPGLVSHFIKIALLNIARDNNLSRSIPKNREEWASLAADLSIKVIHVAERDSQSAQHAKALDEFVCTWSADGLWSESMQPAELGWGSHEKHWPMDACEHEQGSQAAIFLKRPGATTKVRTWTPSFGAFQGYLITHAESISTADYFSIKKDGELLYRPTVHYAYCPCSDARLSLQESINKEMQPLKRNRILMKEITTGIDELGVLLMGNTKGAYWFGSQLSIDEARRLVPYNNATSLQVAAGVLAGFCWVLANPQQGIVEPEAIDFEFILEIAKPYLGKLTGYYTDWTPLKDRSNLFPEDLDKEDPWQFKNIRVN